MSVAMVCRRRKILKLDFLKCSKTVPKNEVWTRKYMIKFLEIMYLFRIFWFSCLKVNKTSKKDNSFYNTLSLEKPHSFYEPQLTRHCRKYTPAIQPKTCFLLEKIFARHNFQTPKNCIFGGLGRQISVNSCKYPFENNYSANVGSFYLVE